MSSRTHPAIALSLATALCVLPFHCAWAQTAAPYQITNGKVDEATYRGWRAYHSACHTCHGVDGVGTSVAPSLVERVRNLSAKQFTIKVITSYRIVMGSSEVTGDDQTAVRERFAEEAMRAESGQLLMPAWGKDPKIQPRVTDLYAYLRARADGALGPGEPQRANPQKTSGDSK